MSLFDSIKNIRDVMRAYDEEYMENEEQPEEQVFEEEPEDLAEEEFSEAKPRFNVFSRREARSEAAPADAKSSLLIRMPVDFDDAAAIADELKARKSVLLNLERTDIETSRRLLDFLSGAAYALGGKISRVSSQAYMLTPKDVVLVGDDISDLINSGFSL